MARIRPDDRMPCGCRAVFNARVLDGDRRIPDVATYDADTKTAEQLMRTPSGALKVEGGSVVTRVVAGPLRLECLTHGEVG